VQQRAGELPTPRCGGEVARQRGAQGRWTAARSQGVPTPGTPVFGGDGGCAYFFSKSFILGFCLQFFPYVLLTNFVQKFFPKISFKSFQMFSKIFSSIFLRKFAQKLSD
jgi:hypothetical protein